MSGTLSLCRQVKMKERKSGMMNKTSQFGKKKKTKQLFRVRKRDYVFVSRTLIKSVSC